MVPEVNAISVGSGGVGRQRARHGLGVDQRVEAGSHHRDDRHVRADAGIECHAPEPLGGDEGARLDGAQDEPDFAGAVEVDDRDHHRTQECRCPEGGRRLHPVRQLEGDHVARTDTAGSQPRRQLAGQQFDVGEGAGVGPLRGVDRERDVRVVFEATRQQIPERVAGPPSLVCVALRQLWRDGPDGETGHDAPLLACRQWPV